MQNYDGQFKLNGQEYFYRAKDDSGSSKITRVTEWLKYTFFFYTHF